MTNIAFLTNGIDIASGALGFFSSSGFGSPIAIGGYNGRSFITDSSGIAMGAEGNNCQYINPTGVVLGQSGSGLLLSQIPNSLSSLNIRATFDTAVRCLNTKLFIWDSISTSITGNTAPMATNLNCFTYEVSHLSNTQTNIGSGGPSANTISGVHAWTTWSGGAVCSGVPLTASPGTSGMRPSGSSTVDNRMDWYVALSVSPVGAGSKSWGLWMQTDYL